MLLSSVACNYLLAEEEEQEKQEEACKEKYKSVKRGENGPKSRVFAIVVLGK